MGTLICTNAYAQTPSLKGFAAGVSLTTNGIGAELDLLLDNHKLTKNQSISLSFQTLKHSRETKVQNSKFVNPKTYVYGKLNAAATLRIGYSWNKQIGQDKSNKPSVYIGYEIGPMLGILKPYYIGYQSPSNERRGPSIIPQNTETIANQDSIVGAADWTLGLNELRYKPGIHISTHISIDWNHSFYFQRWKTGVRFDYFPGELEILHLANNKTFTSVFTSYTLGKQR